MTLFDADLASQLLERIRNGETIRQVCNGKRGSLPLKATDVYDWLRDGKAKMDPKTTFGQAYELACKDRALTWQDMALEMHEGMKLTGLKTDYSVLKQTSDRANLFLRMAKESRDSAKSVTAGTGGDAINVTIRRFGTAPLEVDIEGEDEPEA